MALNLTSVLGSSVFLPNFCSVELFMELHWPPLVYVRTYASFQLSRRSKCLHSFCGSQISQNLTHFHYSKPHHLTSHPEIIHSPGVTHTWLHLPAIVSQIIIDTECLTLSTFSYALRLQPSQSGDSNHVCFRRAF